MIKAILKFCTTKQLFIYFNYSCGTAKIYFNWWEWSFDFNIIASDLAAFYVSLLATIQLLTFAGSEFRQLYSNSFKVSALTKMQVSSAKSRGVLLKQLGWSCM